MWVMPAPHHEDVRPGGWSNRDFDDEVAAPRRFFERGWVAAALTLGTFLVFLYGSSHETNACRLACYDISERPYEPGHPWTFYEGAWQWQAQWGLALCAFVAALLALATSTRYRLRIWTRALNAVAIVLAVGWLVWRALEPALPTI